MYVVQYVFQKFKLCFQVCYLIDFVDIKHIAYNFLKRAKLISSFLKTHFIKLNSFKLFPLSSQKHPPYHHNLQRAILAKFSVQFNLICIYCRHCLHHFSKFSGSHFESIMTNLQSLRIDTCYFYLGKLIHFKIKMPLPIGDLSWYFSKWQLAYLLYFCDIEWYKICLQISLFFVFNDTHMEELVLYWIQHKVHWNTKLAVYEVFHMFIKSVKFFLNSIIVQMSEKRD